MSKNVEVEGGEIMVFSSSGSAAIIPKNRVAWVKKKLEEGCDTCLDHYISKLPKISGK